MVSGDIFSIGIAVAAVLAFVAYRRRYPTRRTLPPPPVGAAVARWMGSYRTGPVTSLWMRAYRAQLEFFDWGIRVSSIWPWKQMLPTWEFRYDELRNVQQVRWPPLGEGVLLRSYESEVPRVFITSRAPQILVQFAMRGVSVQQEVGRLNRADLRA